MPWPRDDERPGPQCYCGKSGCIETFISGPALARQYAELTGQSLSARELAAAAQAGDAAASECLVRYEDRLARSLASVVNILDPDAIVLGGGVSNIARLSENLAARIAQYAFSDRIDTTVAKALHGDSSGVRGAAWLWGAAAR